MDESPTLADPTLGWLLLNDDTHMRKEIHLPRLPEQHSESSNEVGEIFISYSVHSVQGSSKRLFPGRENFLPCIA